MKKVVILGATGSLGRQTLEVLKKYPKEFEVYGITGYTQREMLKALGRKFRISPERVILAKNKSSKSLEKLATDKKVDIVINVLSGTVGIASTVIALKSGKILLLGNKESLICEGNKLKKYSKQIIPIDSEHNAIYEILKKFPKKKIKSITLPCSGGPLWDKTKRELQKVKVKEALNHPRWKMGKKILVESATLINKGMEIIEAHYLFNLPLSKIKTALHRECIIHGIVEFTDENSYCYISKPDMREHIENALLRSLKRAPLSGKVIPLNKSKYKLEKINNKNLTGIDLVLKQFQQSPNRMKKFLEKEERVVKKFLEGKIKFRSIFKLLRIKQ